MRTPEHEPAAAARRYEMGSLNRALDLLELVGHEPGLTLSELGRRSGLSKVTTFRILANLEHRSYVRRDGEAGRYSLGPKVIQLGGQLFEALDLRLIARPLLEDLWRRSGETVNLAVPVDDSITYIDILQSPQGLRMAARVGATDDLHSTALGKAMLAFEPEAAVIEVARHRGLVRKTDRTISDVHLLLEDLRAVRERGYSIDDEENEPGARCVAAPVLGPMGSVVGAISISGPATRVTSERLPDLGVAVRRVGERISERLGHRPTRVATMQAGKLDAAAIGPEGSKAGHQP
jgi:DNA-binding IclR family transcriptional regulator